METIENVEYPLIIQPSVEMSEVNQPIHIYTGAFVLKNTDTEIPVQGEINFEWFPNSGAHFEAIIERDFAGHPDFNNYELVLDGLVLGKCFITNIIHGKSGEGDILKGTLSERTVRGDKSIAAGYVRFSIANLREFDGGLPVLTSRKGISSSRMIFENETYSITIDEREDFKNLSKSLEAKGGYLILHGGEIRKKKGDILLEEIKDLVHSFDTFLWFLNGRRTSLLFLRGMYENEELWFDCTDYFVDIHKKITTWPQKRSINGLNELWQKFNKLWQNEDERTVLTTAIHWYLEANSQNSFSEGSIIMAQTALELLYNWLVVEQRKLIIGKDSDNIGAANKVRLLISQLGINGEVQPGLKKLKAFVTENEYADGPEAVVQIRNAIVHSQQEKRKKLNSISTIVKYEALQLCIWYIELSLLYILDYTGKYYNRCSGEFILIRGEQLVPWQKNHSPNPPIT